MFNKTIAGRRRTLLLTVKPARMSVKSSLVPSLSHTRVLLGGFYRLHWRSCAEDIAVDVNRKTLKFLAVLTLRKKSDTEIKS